MPATRFLSKLNEGQMHAHLSELYGVAGHYIIYSTLSIFPTFLILAVDRNFKFDGATACLMQFRLLHPGGGMVSQQVKSKNIPYCTCTIIDWNHVFPHLFLSPHTYLVFLLHFLIILLHHPSSTLHLMTFTFSPSHHSCCSPIQSHRAEMLLNTQNEISKPCWRR